MNIFILDEIPNQAARSLCGQHVVKMGLETAQLLSTVCHVQGCWKFGMYKPTHIKHPCTKWLLSNRKHVQWLKL